MKDLTSWISMRRRAVALGVLVAGAVVAAWPVPVLSGHQPRELRVMTSGATTAAHLALAPLFERQSGAPVRTLATSAGLGATSIASRVRRGEDVDIVMLSRAALDELAADGSVFAASVTDLARSSVGVAVRVGAPLNAVGTYLARSLGGPMTGNDMTHPTDEHRWVLSAIDVETGKVRWDREIRGAVPAQPVHQKNSFASETPVTDGQRVYVYLGYAGLFAFDMPGTPVWSKPMETPRMRTGWGTASSPVLHDGRLYIVSDNEGRSFVAAFDANRRRDVAHAS